MKTVDHNLTPAAIENVPMLQPIHETATNELAALFLRAASARQAERVISLEIDACRTEISLLHRRIGSLCLEREMLMEKINTLQSEISSIRQELC